MKNTSFFYYVLIGLLTFSCSKESLKEESVATSLTNTVTKLTLTRSDFMLGVNGHPLNQAAYNTPAYKQIDLLEKLNMGVYRIDVPFSSSTGQISNLSAYARIKSSADSAGITLLPMVPTATLNFTGTETAAYQSGYTRAFNFGSQYKNDFKYYNLGNELDNECIKTGTGRNESDYDSVKFKIIAAHLKGMDEGIKAADPDAETMVVAGWLHYKYLQMLEDYGVNFDIVAYHWYDNMETNAAGSPYFIPDITQYISSKFTKPIWFTETGSKNSGTDPDSVQRNFLNSFLAKCQNNPQVKAAIIYELFDQPLRAGNEANYGLYRWITPYTSYAPKLWAQEHETP
ncbi:MULTISPECIES: glycosyl hydrolase [Olivibacter]|uniref:Glycosyl hydrolase n=1 Tax=Olivibacter jilunii TaxID=985016 RepID=A0ABW6B748_9SPHI|nr:glycoside hydrolase family protein [Olivibacter sp. UJ_SKK_5.1]MDX3915928.1 glycosyl hydrolase [Pseudosphingobacterium sp.]